jgi:hypothetical protein
MASFPPLAVSLDQSLYAAEVKRSISKFGLRKVDGETDVVDISVELASTNSRNVCFGMFAVERNRHSSELSRSQKGELKIHGNIESRRAPGNVLIPESEQSIHL